MFHANNINMEKKVYITKTSSFFPNEPVKNDDMENYLGFIGNKPSRVKNIVLRQNGIMQRYYALNTNQEITHTNAQLAALSIRKLFDNEEELNQIEALVCATTSPDQYLPSHAAMVHGELLEKPVEIFSLAGICMCGMHAFKTAYMSIKSNNTHNAVCSTSEVASPGLLSKFYDAEYEAMTKVEENPIMAFEKDFLRFMLSDGASAVFMSDQRPDEGGLEVEWIETISYANRQPACMYMLAEATEDGSLKSWKEYSAETISEKSIWAVKQNVKLLNSFVVPYFVDAIEYALSRHQTDLSKVRYVIPHISSMYFYEKLSAEIQSRGIALTKEKWFTNLTTVGNIASAAAFAGLDELLKTKQLNKGEQIMLLVPESGRFSYGVALLTVL